MATYDCLQYIIDNAMEKLMGWFSDSQTLAVQSRKRDFVCVLDH